MLHGVVVVERAERGLPLLPFLNALVLARDYVLLGGERDCGRVKGIIELQVRWLLIVAVRRLLFVESLCADEHIKHIKALGCRLLLGQLKCWLMRLFLKALIALGCSWVGHSRLLLGFKDGFELDGDIGARGSRFWHLETMTAVIDALWNHTDVIVQR